MGALVALLLVVAPPPADPGLERAERAFQDLELDQAEKLFLEALEQPATLDERRRAWKGLALSQAFQGETREAQSSFETLLLLDPQATISSALGPKISGPFAAAKASLGAKKNRLELSRERGGAVAVKLSEDVPLARELELHARAKGEPRYKTQLAKAGEPLSLAFSPAQDVEAWVETRDAQGGVVYLLGAADAPRELPAPASRAVASVVEQAQREAEGNVEPDGEEAGSSRWPLVLGGVGAAVVVGIAAGVVATQRPPALKLPPADRTGQLP